MKSLPSDISGYRAPAVHRAFEILRYVAEARQQIGLSELSRHLGISKSTIHGLIQALLEIGALEHSRGHKKYVLGPAIVDLAFNSWNYLRIREEVQPTLNALRDRIDETVFLGVLSNTRGIVVAVAEANSPLKISSPPGTSIPLMAGAVGKVFLAQLDDKQARNYIKINGLPRFTVNSITDEDAYLSELQQVRNQGYALDDEQYLTGVRAVAVSLGNCRGLPLALWVVGFSSSMDDEKILEVIEKTTNAAAALKSALSA